MEKQISIIIPTYNMEKYIGKCLDSLLIPDFDKVEVLVVNDGSKDRSSEIAHRYADRYPASIKVIDKENGNYGSCINAALPILSGRYVKVLDADDTFDNAAFENLVKYLYSAEAEVVITNYDIVDEEGKITSTKNFSTREDIEINKVYDFDEALRKSLFDGIIMHAITYKREIFNRFEYRQTEGVSFSDKQWAIIPLTHSKNIQFSGMPSVYKYLVGREGQTVSPDRFSKQLDGLCLVFKDMLTLLNSTFNSEARKNLYHNLVLREIYYFLFFQTIKYCKDKSVLKKFDEYLLKEYPEVHSALGKMPYAQSIDYYMIQDLRRKKYCDNFKMPLHVKLQIVRKRLFNKFK